MLPEPFQPLALEPATVTADRQQGASPPHRLPAAHGMPTHLLQVLLQVAIERARLQVHVEQLQHFRVSFFALGHQSLLEVHHH